jgi:DNA-binding transcriptional LysR family regulator
MSEPVDLQLLAAFVAVAETSSFTKAAERLNVTPATVSRSLARLEATLGVELVHRTTRSVSVSSAGAQLLERAGPHVAALAQAVRDLPDRLPEPAGTLRLTAPYALGLVLLGDVIARYTARYPRVRVEADFTNRNLDLVAEGFDLAIRGDAGQMTDSTVVTRRVLQRDALRLYASPGYLARRGEPRHVGSADHNWIGFGGSRTLSVEGWPAEPTIVANDFLFLREATRAGAGVGLLPWFIADPLVRNAELVQVLHQVELRGGSLVLLYPTRGAVPAKVSAFRDLLVAAMNPSEP